MTEVTVRDARREDAPALAAVWAAAVPYLVRSSRRAEAELSAGPAAGVRRWAGLADGEVVGTATARGEGEERTRVNVEVQPSHRRLGVGSALLTAAVAGAGPGLELWSVATDDVAGTAFAERHGFEPMGRHRVSMLRTGEVTPPGEPPAPLTAVTADRLPDLRALLETYNLTAPDDPSGLSHTHTFEEFRAEWWESADNDPGLGWCLLEDDVVAAFSLVNVDHVRGRAWSSMTGTHPSYRGRGLGAWVKRRTLAGLAGAGVAEAWTANDSTNGPMLAVNEALGYRVAATMRSVRRPVSG